MVLHGVFRQEHPLSHLPCVRPGHQVSEQFGFPGTGCESACENSEGFGEKGLFDGDGDITAWSARCIADPSRVLRQPQAPHPMHSTTGRAVIHAGLHGRAGM